MLVGADRHTEVDRLVSLFDRIRSEASPMLVVYIAPSGWGKTRIIQEFYHRLAASQPEPRYWPASLVPEPANGTPGLADLTVGRKTVRHATFSVPEDARVPWLWLASPSARLGDGSPAPALGHLSTQVAPHLRHLATRPHAPDEPEPHLGHGDSAGALVTTLHDIAGRLASVIVLDDAHNLDSATVRFVTDVLGSDLPVLFVATAWPDRVAARNSPFTRYLADAATAERIVRVRLDPLTTDDIVGYVRQRFPGTDPGTAAALADRTGRNPYLLRLLLGAPAVRAAIRDGRIALSPHDVGRLRGGPERLLRAHWTQLPIGVRQTLATAALLGESVPEAVLIEALGPVRPAGGLAAALASPWLRATPNGAVEFVEQLRYETARAAAPDVLSATQRRAVLTDALHAVRHLLGDRAHPPDAATRHVLLATHVGLAAAGVEPNVLAAAASAAALAELARAHQRLQEAIRYLERAVAWTKRGGQRASRQLVGYAVELATLIRVELGRARSETAALNALKLAEAHLPAHDELRIQAMLALARARRRRADWQAYQDSLRMLRQAERLVRSLPDPSPELIRDLWAFEASVAGYEGRRSEARDRARRLVAYCERLYGPYHRHTLAAIEDFAFHALRAADLTAAIEARRRILARRLNQAHGSGQGQAAQARTNLADTLVRLDAAETDHTDAGVLDEAEQLAAAACTTWSRSYGIDGDRTQQARLVLARVWQRRGLHAEQAGDLPRAHELFERAARETAAICDLRADRAAGPRSLALMRHGVSLACLRDDAAIDTLIEALRLRESGLRQDRTVWEVRECAEFLSWAHQRLGSQGEAMTIRRSYQLRGD
jgi:tetratricopeptide (TPR) repeat protein